MAFPTTGLIDDFNRADEGPPPSANWTGGVIGGAGLLAVVSNACVATSGGGQDAWWNPGTFGPDAEAYINATTYGASFVQFYIRMVSPGSTPNGYVVRCFTTLGRTFRMDAGVNTQLGGDYTPSLASGDSVGVDMIGSTIVAHKKTSGVWSALDTETDTTYTAAGYLGLRLGAVDSVTDDFSGGTVVAAAGATPPLPVYVDSAVDLAASR